MAQCVSPMARTVTVAEAAVLLGISRRTLYRRIEAGEIPATTVAGRRLIILDAEPDGTVSVTDGTVGTNTVTHSVPETETSVITQGNSAGGTQAGTPEYEDLRARLADMERQRDRWMGQAEQLAATVREQNQTIQAQTIRLAQLEGRMIDASTVPQQTPQGPVQPPEPATMAVTPPRRWSLRALYRAWRGR